MATVEELRDNILWKEHVPVVCDYQSPAGEVHQRTWQQATKADLDSLILAAREEGRADPAAAEGRQGHLRRGKRAMNSLPEIDKLQNDFIFERLHDLGPEKRLQMMTRLLKLAREEGARQKGDKENVILKAALTEWGVDKQLMVLIEECGELVQAAAKYKAGREPDADHVIEEIADVEIMIDQMRLVWGDDIDAVRTAKLKRLDQRLHPQKEAEHDNQG